MTTYVEARFAGRQDPDYHHDHLYQLRIRQHWGGKINVTATHGYYFKPVVGVARTYARLSHFLQDWVVVRVVRPREE